MRKRYLISVEGRNSIPGTPGFVMPDIDTMIIVSMAGKFIMSLDKNGGMITKIWFGIQFPAIPG